jgi:hypothetical protein
MDLDEMKRTFLFTASMLVLDLGGCVFVDKQIGDDEGAEDETNDTDTNNSDTGDEDTGDEGTGSEPFDECEGPFPSPAHDQDCDSVGLSCDNAREVRNPDQLDQDDDQFGDVIDLCPLLAGPNNTGDSDRDGIGNACDVCPKQAELYNVVQLGIDPRMWVRNVPDQGDFDQDGVGDVCDNCITVPNCEGFGPGNPAPHGAEAGEGDQCQFDADLDGIGDACEPLEPSPIGLTATDDFDQDGVVNEEDACPRQPVESQVCTSDADCEDGSECAVTPALDLQRRCNHVDSDDDNVGDVCDTCSAVANPLQVTDGGMQVDDEDEDFVGGECETHVECTIRTDARPIGFYDVAAAGYCCVTTYPGDDALHDPDGAPIRLDCPSDQEEQGLCRQVPAVVVAQPGVVELPLGCTAALADAGVDEATPLTLADFDGDAAALWANACMLPQRDQDFDALGDACDLCPFGFDPLNEPYVDDFGTLWPEVGEFCAGEHAPELVPGAACEWP